MQTVLTILGLAAVIGVVFLGIMFFGAGLGAGIGNLIAAFRNRR